MSQSKFFQPNQHNVTRNIQQLSKIHIAPNRLQATIQKIMGGKIFLSFEAQTIEARVTKWLEAYNENAKATLKYEEELCNSLFVCFVLVDDIESAKKDFLEKSPLKVFGYHASVNNYTIDFDPRNPRDFKHLVTIYINQGSRVIHEHLFEIVEKVGRLLLPYIDSGIANHRVTTLIETTQCDFLLGVLFPLGAS